MRYELVKACGALLLQGAEKTIICHRESGHDGAHEGVEPCKTGAFYRLWSEGKDSVDEVYRGRMTK